MVVDLTRRVFLERLAQFYASLAISILAVVVNTIILSVLLWTPANSTTVLAWCGATLAVSLFRVVGIFRYRRCSSDQREATATRWYR